MAEWIKHLLHGREEQSGVPHSARMWVGSRVSDSSSRGSETSGLRGHLQSQAYTQTQTYAHIHDEKHKHLKVTFKNGVLEPYSMVVSSI